MQVAVNRLQSRFEAQGLMVLLMLLYSLQCPSHSCRSRQLPDRMQNDLFSTHLLQIQARSMRMRKVAECPCPHTQAFYIHSAETIQYIGSGGYILFNVNYFFPWTTIKIPVSPGERM